MLATVGLSVVYHYRCILVDISSSSDLIYWCAFLRSRATVWVRLLTFRASSQLSNTFLLCTCIGMLCHELVYISVSEKREQGEAWLKQAKLPGTEKQCCQVASQYWAQSGSQPCVLLAENCKAVMSSEKV